MKLNEFTVITGKNVTLVPYKDYHVEKLHKWMQTPEILTLMGTEPATLEELYATQRKFYEDDDKCTFIILDKYHYDLTLNEVDSMIGDVNLYLIDEDYEHAVGKIEIMIGDETFRHQKRGWEAAVLMMIYGIETLKLKTFEAEIININSVAINMFEKLTFQRRAMNMFEEVVMRKTVTQEWTDWLYSQTSWGIKKTDQMF